MLSDIRMDPALLPLLPSLVALVEEEAVGRAAKRLGVSQPRMSARLAMLRTLLRDPLLVQASGARGLIATDRARSLADSGRRALADLDTAVAGDAFDPTTAVQTFAVMANDNAAAIAGLPLLEAVRAAPAPGVRVSLRQFDKARLHDLEDGRIDLALGAPSQLEETPALITRTIVRDGFVSAVRKGERTAGDLEEFCGRDHVLVSGDGGGFDGLVDRALAAHGRRRRVVLSVQSYLLAIEAVATSDMVATLPLSLLAGQERGLVLFEPPMPLPPFTLAAAWHARVDADPAHRWLRSRLNALPL